MKSGVEICMNYAQNQILKRHDLVIHVSTKNGFKRHRQCVQHQGEYFEKLCRSQDVPRREKTGFLHMQKQRRRSAPR